ncbi:MAG TPA: methyltransferase domain-containing protein [Dehalococcoidia bacterium]
MAPDHTELRDVADFYDAPGIVWAPRMAGTHLHAGGEDATVLLAQRLEAYGFPGGGRVLEIAAALGGPACYLARRFQTTVCIDASPRMHTAARMAAVAKEPALRVSLLLAHSEALPLNTACCDVVWSQDALYPMDSLP